MGFSLSESFRLELHWDDTKYESPGRCELKSAYFSGPVLQVAQKINSNDDMMLDFFSQYIRLVNSVYVAKLSWFGAEYSDDGLKVLLKHAIIEHKKELNNVPTFSNTDWLMIDCRGHDVENHPYNLVYKTYVMNSNKDLYRFGK